MAEAKKKTTEKKKTPAKGNAAKQNVKKTSTVKKSSAPRKKAAPKKAAKTGSKSWFCMSIAEKTAFRKRNKVTILSILALIPLAALWFLFTFLIQGYSFTALVCAGLMGLILFYNLMPLVGRKYPNFSKAVTRIVTVILCIGLLIAAVTECIIIKYSFGSPEDEVQYLVVLGAKVRLDGPSVSLQNRIDKAYDYLTAHPDTIAIVSGGQGDDEPMSEAQCMYDHLVRKGIAPERIWMEDKATSTWENLRFSLDLIEEKCGQRPEKLGVLSSEYHMFRASLFTKAAGAEFVGIPAHTTRLSQMINHFMREVAGVWHYILLGSLGGKYNG